MRITNCGTFGNWLGGIALLGLLACSSGAPSQPASSPKAIPVSVVDDSLIYSLPYDLSQADDTFFLPSQLVEVSGLSYLSPNQLGLVQDERGVIYFWDLATESISKEFHFGKSGDYEGIEIVDGHAYVLKSNGKISEIKNVLSDTPEPTHEYNNALNSDDDTEGLGYDPGLGKLLIACKEPYRTPASEVRNKRAIYGYDPQTHAISSSPLFVLNTDEIGAFLNAYAKDTEIAKKFEPQKKSSIKPSGIAVDPKTGYTYVIASVGKILIVLNQSHQVVAVQKLPKEIFLQPEGICFSPEGQLYISNEGGNGKGYILSFAPTFSP